MNRLRSFMIGRYGVDKLNLFLLIVTTIASVICNIFQFELGMFLIYIPIIWCIFRMFSRDIYKRSSENQWFLNRYYPLEKQAIAIIHLLVGTKTHRYYKCPNCKQTIRVPRGRGKICITCSKCKNEFIKKS